MSNRPEARTHTPHLTCTRPLNATQSVIWPWRSMQRLHGSCCRGTVMPCGSFTSGCERHRWSVLALIARSPKPALGEHRSSHGSPRLFSIA